MNLKELHSFKLSDAIKFHDELNPKLFHGQHLNSVVKRKLLVIAEDFLNELGISNLKVKDITVSGSNAAFTYTPHSDLDLHILVDMSELDNDEVYKELFNAKKDVYNDSHDITIKDIPVELYIQDSNQPVVSLGEYSLLNDKWLRIPTKRRANFDQNATKSKYEKLKSLADRALLSHDLAKVKRSIDKIKRYRQAGLEKAGEFGPENLAYKMLRTQNYIKKLYELRDKLHSEKLSFETMYQNIQPVEETSAPDVVDNTPQKKVLYHVTTTTSVPRIKKRGILPLQPSNWVQAGTGQRYGGGEIFAFDNLSDAQIWAGKMDWEHNTKVGTGKISIVKFTDDGDWEQDTAPLVAYKGNALKKHGRVKPKSILDVEPFTSESVKSLIASNKITEERTTLQKMYGNNLPNDREIFWNYVSTRDLEKPLEIKTMPRHKVKIQLLSQYKVEHIDELVDLLDDEQLDNFTHYVSDPNLSDEVIVIDDNKIIDGNHRALAAAVKGVPIKYVDLSEPLDEVTIDNRGGWGAVPYNQDVDYFGLRVKMTPKTFLKLAAPLDDEPSEKIYNHIQKGGAIGAPHLYIIIPEDWDNKDFSMPAQVAQHEGRNRMKSILKIEGNHPIEVHLFPLSGYRNRDLTPEFIKTMNKGLYAEKSRTVIPGPLFSVSGNTQSVTESSDSLASLAKQDQAERNQYKSFVASQADGDYTKGASMYASLKKRPIDDIFDDKERLTQFIRMNFDFDKFTNSDWDNYWTLAQHCDFDHDFQKKALAKIKKYQGKDHDNYKYLYDRISLALTGKQKYGTQEVIEGDILKFKGRKRDNSPIGVTARALGHEIYDQPEEQQYGHGIEVKRISQGFGVFYKGELESVHDDSEKAHEAAEDLASEIKDGEGLTESHAKTPTVGINIRSDGDIDYADLIVDGKKKYETRNTDSLRSYVGKTVGIIRTGNGPAVAIGQATIGEPIIADEKKFERLRKKHLVPKGSKFDIDSNGTKYLYPIIDPVRWDDEKVVKRKGIVARKIDEMKSEEDYNGITMSLEKNIHDELYVTASVDGKELGHVLFVIGGEYLLPQDLEVKEKYRGQGIATAMYDYVKSKGYKIRRSGQQTDDGAKFWTKHRPKQNFWEQEIAEASGYIPSKAQKNDPRYKTALTVDVKPDSIKKNAKAFGFKTSRAGIPPTARPDGKV
jgi:hypothetical protein